MTHIFERMTVQCPYALARRCVHDGEALQIQSPVSSFVVQLEHTADPLRFDERLRVHWQSKHGGFTRFTGEIVLRADPAVNAAVLELSGDYYPPLGAAARTFDLFDGTRIASITAKRVLRTIADAIEGAAANTR